jgi:hypothetical protein
MIFKITHTVSDTCGNTKFGGPDEYIEADSVEAAWKKLGSLSISAYWVGSKYVPRRRLKPNVSLQRSGEYEFNPLFDWNRDMDKATSFESSMGFSGIEVSPITIRK